MVGFSAARRRFLGAATLAMTTPPIATTAQIELATGRLGARPARQPPTSRFPSGLHHLGSGPDRDGLIYVPSSIELTRPAPFLLMLHGAGGIAAQVMPMLQRQAEEHGIVVLAPDSRGRTWDVVLGGYGPDVRFIDNALAHVFHNHHIDPSRMAVAGFSDGASYALSLGLTNGDLFADILAFSPGFAAPQDQRGKPRIFISHGRQDQVLPIEHCGRRLARDLAAAHYDVDYREFAEGHEVPPTMVDAAIMRMLT